MAIKLLENAGIENTGIGASALNNLITGNKSGIVGKYLNECAFTATGNTIIIDKGLLIICGRQVELDAIESVTLSSLPSEDVRYQIVIELIREESGEVTASIFARQPSTLIQENLLKDGFVYQFELGRVTHKTTGQVTEVLRTADILTAGGGGGADFEIGDVTTEMLAEGIPAEVDIEKRTEDDKTFLDFTFAIPNAFNDLAAVQGMETDKAPTNKLLKESSFARVYREATEISGITYPVEIGVLLKTMKDKNLFNTMLVVGLAASTETKVTGLPTLGGSPQTYGMLVVQVPGTDAQRMRVEYSKREAGTGNVIKWIGGINRIDPDNWTVDWKMVIDDSTAQTITGVKTYTASPLVPTTPSGPSAAVAKSYVDALYGTSGLATLLSTNWLDGAYTLTVAALGTDDAIFITPSTSADKTLIEAANFFVSASGTTVTITAETVPTVDIDIDYFITRGKA